MKKILFFLMFVLLIFSASPVHAEQPDMASGEWSYMVTDWTQEEVGGNFVFSTYDIGKWEGTFEGTSTEVGLVVIFRSGNSSFKGTLTFEGEVDGRSGTFTMSVVGRKSGVEDWKGQWVILNGTGELANLCGQGTWFGPGAAGFLVWGTVEYEGNYHFEPEG